MFENDFRDTREMNRQDRDEQMELAAVCHRDAYGGGRGGRCGGGWDRGGPIMIGPEPPILIPPRPPVFVMPMPRYGGDCYGGGSWDRGCQDRGGWDRGGWDRGGWDRGGWDRGGWDRGGRDRGYDYYPMQGGNYSRDTVSGGRDGYSADRTRYNGGGYNGGGWNGGYNGGYNGGGGWDQTGQVFDFALRGFDTWAGYDIARRYANQDQNQNNYGRGGGGYNDRNNRGNYQRGWQR